MNKFWNDNKVFIMGLLGAVAIVLQDYLGTEEISWSSVALAVGISALGYVAKEWRGQGLSIIGIIGVAADVVYTLQQTGTLTWEKALIGFVVAIIAASAPDPKSRGYEQTDTIKSAKAEGESIKPASFTAKPKV